MPGPLVEQLLYLADHAYEVHGEHSLMRNLAAVGADDWLWTAPGGSRSFRQIVGHVGACKYMYDNFAFGDSKMTWNDPAGALGCSMEELQSASHLAEREPEMTSVLEWLREGHLRLRDHIASLGDEDLSTARRRPEGGTKETRWIIAVMIEHDLYHAGEINHLRALKQGNDRWPWQD
jgi:uncharacterized damage-inducible protein DinB